MIMKKNIFKLFSVMVVSATVLTGCIEEVFPEDSTTTSDQIGASATAIEASLNGKPLSEASIACHRKWYKAI